MKGHNYGLCKKCGKFHKPANPNPSKGFQGKHHSIATRLRMRELRLGKKHTEETRKKISVATKGEKNPRARWFRMTREDALELLHKWEESGLNIVDFASQLHGSATLMGRMFKRLCPQEYAETTRKHKLSRAKNGWDFQRDVADLFEKRGYVVFWVGGLNIGDMIALKPFEQPILIEATLQKWGLQKKERALMELARKAGCKGVLATKPDPFGDIIEKQLC